MRRLVLLLPVLALLACNSDPSSIDPGLRLRLRQAETTWLARRPLGYTMVQTRSCECLPIGPVRLDVLRVDSGDDPRPAEVIVAATFVPTGEAVPSEQAGVLRTIEGLFGMLHDAIEQGADRLNAEFHPEYGYPLVISVDYDLDYVDDEILVHTTDFAITPVD